MALGLLLLGLHLWKAGWARRKILEIVDASQAQPGPQRDLCHNSALPAYTEGFVTGSSTAFGLALGFLFLVRGAGLRFGGRKARLLLDHFNG